VKRENQNRRIKAKPASGSRWIMAASAIIFVSSVSLIGWAAIRLVDPATLPIREVRIQGEFRKLLPEKLQALVAHKVTGGFFTVAVSPVRDVLMEDPWVRDVSVRRVWPDRLEVTILEQRAVVQWDADGLLNDEGMLFKPDRESFPERLAQLTGPEGTEVQVLREYRLLQEMLAPLSLRIVSVALSQRRAWSFELYDGPKVVLGRDDFERRIRRFLTDVQTALGERISVVTEVDLRYTNGFAVRGKSSDERRSAPRQG